jgi:hypothetical protein
MTVNKKFKTIKNNQNPLDMKRILNKAKLLPGVLAGCIILISSCAKDPIPVTDITLDKANATIQVSATVTLKAFVTPADADNQNISWRSADISVATVNNGVVTGVSLGTTTITAISQADTTLKKTCAVLVTPSTGQVIEVSGDITENATWYATAKYMLSGFVYVKNNAILTIEPGTIIKGVSNTKAALIVERGSKINAAGTASLPIVFTSDKPKGQRARGDWGGVVLCGKATTNKHDNGAGVGIAEGGIGSNYGGTDDNDNSGILQYVRIEFPGIPLTATANSEINGLTLYAVGKGTTIDHIQVSYSGDDSFEWFGGAVNCKYLVCIRGLDDEYDTDNGFKGNLQFLFGLRDPEVSDQSGSNGFESDNDADGSTLTPVTKPIFSNVTLYGPLTVSASLPANHLFKRAIHIRRSSQLSVYNSVFAGWPVGLLLDGTLGNTPTAAENNDLQIENCIIAGMTANYAETSGTPATPYTLVQTEAYYTAPARANAINSLSEIIGASLLSLTGPVLLPEVGSPALTGASFTNSRLTDSFFTPVTYKGAFGTTDWTAGWCNFDPQNTDY